ncbi:uncharacterized mitochondrial protein AtMg00810-like [Benincasa hispida]|uniref:uncharacterized mitochondrial protein AtMg00810-like n=1 Tax=Benincasa hispida TaxID=102211 RepID=UPI0018FFD00D|nr:uncharacterized mitochondrial protein AtMg00810-like [Benincasa hispida]
MSTVGELMYFLGFQVKKLPDGIFISQGKYARNMLKNFGHEKANPKHTPAPAHVKLAKDSNVANFDESLYRNMIGSLHYLTASRPNMAYAIEVYARYQANPKTSRLTSVKRILKYITGTVNYELHYSFDTSGAFVGSCDADSDYNSGDRKSTS